ncbi:MAG: hypothetical protein OXT49_09750 [Gammaproteobacteria bacterium]|nr:hypothetical protein [Gammaproteobacteria bacterium]
MIEIALTSTALLISTVAFMAVWQQRQNRLQAERNLRYIAGRQAELVLLAENHQLLVDTQELLEEGIEGTTATVRAIHKGIASIPFGILEAIPVTRDTTRVVRGTHDIISDVVYSGISAANKTSGKVIRKGINAPKEK